MSSDLVLIVSREQDVHARAVIEHLPSGVEFVLLDLSEFPVSARLCLAFEGGRRGMRLRLRDGPVDFDRVRSVWWRRPQPLVVDPSIGDEGHRMFATNEAHEAIAGLWQNLEFAHWVNPADLDAAAHRKVYQLRIAQEVGLQIPKTLITNDPDQARDFVARRSGSMTVFKAFSATERHWRETRLMGEAEIEKMDDVELTPVIFQEYIDALFDVRVTIVGDEVFAAAIHSQQTSYKIDFRMDIQNAKTEAFELPSDVKDKLLALMNRLGLRYGAIDMRLDSHGRHVFLEINPAGQWLFIEEKTGQPIARTLAEHLAAGHGARAR